jgi:hypothetical protein
VSRAREYEITALKLGSQSLASFPASSDSSQNEVRHGHAGVWVNERCAARLASALAFSCAASRRAARHDSQAGTERPERGTDSRKHRLIGRKRTARGSGRRLPAAFFSPQWQPVPRVALRAERCAGQLILAKKASTKLCSPSRDARVSLFRMLGVLLRSRSYPSLEASPRWRKPLPIHRSRRQSSPPLGALQS